MRVAPIDRAICDVANYAARADANGSNAPKQQGLIAFHEKALTENQLQVTGV